MEQDSFAKFCEDRMISIETQIRFREWFKKYYSKLFIYNDVTINYIMSRMKNQDISIYWNMFVKDWKNNLEK